MSRPERPAAKTKPDGDGLRPAVLAMAGYTPGAARVAVQRAPYLVR